jgi:hypothetical protein
MALRKVDKCCIGKIHGPVTILSQLAQERIPEDLHHRIHEKDRATIL